MTSNELPIGKCKECNNTVKAKNGVFTCENCGVVLLIKVELYNNFKEALKCQKGL